MLDTFSFFVYNTPVMKKVTQKQVREWLKVLAKCQGTYERLYNRFINSTPKARQNYLNYLNANCVSNVHDFVSLVEEPRTIV